MAIHKMSNINKFHMEEEESYNKVTQANPNYQIQSQGHNTEIAPAE